MRKFLTAKWENIIMANYEIDPAILSPYLPKGVELDYFEGRAAWRRWRWRGRSPIRAWAGAAGPPIPGN